MAEFIGLLGFMESAKQKGIIKDFIGIGQKVEIPPTLIFSSIIGKETKPYLAMYMLFVARLKREMPNFRFTIHLEDWFPASFLNRLINPDSTRRYLEYISRFEVADISITTSSIPIKIIPQQFIKDNLSRVSLGDFISVLPFTKHSLDNISLSDLLHFA